MLLAIVGQMASFAAMLLVGLACARFRIVEPGALPSVITLASKVFLPALLFSVVSKSLTMELLEDHWVVLPITLALYGLLAALMHALARVLRLEGRRSIVFQMSFVFGNTGFIGLPLLVSVLPETGAANLALFMVVDQLLFWTFGLGFQEEGRRRATPWMMLRRFLNPNIVAMLLAFGSLLFGIRVPASVLDMLSTFGSAASPLCLVCLGALSLHSDMGSALRQRELHVGILVKMVALPVCAAPLLWMLPIAQDIAISMILMIAMPTTVLVPLIMDAGRGNGPSATPFAIATIAFSTFSLPLVALLSGIT